MSEDTWKEGDDIFVNFGGANKTKKSITTTSGRTIYNNMDLSSGYHKSEIWTTKDGRNIAIPNLADQHLLNIIAFLRRHTEDYRKMIIGEIASGIAQNALVLNMFDIPDIDEHKFQTSIKKAKEEGLRIFKLDGEELLREFFPKYTKLLTECYRRKILIEVDATKLGSGDSNG